MAGPQDRKDDTFSRKEVYGSGHKRRKSWAAQRRERTFQDWYGPQGADLEIEGRQPPPQQLADLIGAELVGMNADNHQLMRSLMDAWEDLIPPEISSIAGPQRFYRGCLYIEVWEQSWIFILRTRHERELMAILRRHSQGRIRRIQFVPGGSTNDRSGALQRLIGSLRRK